MKNVGICFKRPNHLVKSLAKCRVFNMAQLLTPLTCCALPLHMFMNLTINATVIKIS